MRPRLSRRSFLKLSAAGMAGWGLSPGWAAPAAPAAAPRVAATLPLPMAQRYFPNPEAFLTKVPAGYDLLMVPAFVAAGLIRRRRLLPLAGPAGRAHDPEGAYTVPYLYAAGAVVHPAGPAPADPWQDSVAWPAFGRLLLGAALQRRGYSPNDAHAGRVAQAGADLLALRPAVTSNPLAALQAGTVASALVPVPLGGSGELEVEVGLSAAMPPWGGVLIEYDWVIPTTAPDPQAAQAFIEALPPSASAPALPDGMRLVPLAPLPDRTQDQYAQLWADLSRGRRADFMGELAEA